MIVHLASRVCNDAGPGPLLSPGVSDVWVAASLRSTMYDSFMSCMFFLFTIPSIFEPKGVLMCYPLLLFIIIAAYAFIIAAYAFIIALSDIRYIVGRKMCTAVF